MGRALITMGVLLIVIGLAITYGPKLPFRVGRLPGDIYIHKNNSSFYFPITTCILVSVVISAVLWLLRR